MNSVVQLRFCDFDILLVFPHFTAFDSGVEIRSFLICRLQLNNGEALLNGNPCM